MKTKIKLLLGVSLFFIVGISEAQTWFHAAGELRTGIPNGGFGGASAFNGSLLFYNSTNTNTVNFLSGATTTSYSLTLPIAQGAASTVLTNNGSGTLSWATAAGIGGWSILGNSGTTAGTNFIGTIDNVDWVVKTYNTERMRVLSGGNVGIGTTSPEASLSVMKGAVGNVATFGYPGTTLNQRIIIKLDQNISGGAEAGLITLSNTPFTSTGTTTPLAFGVSNGSVNIEAMRISGSGNVGIGTTTPGYKLEVNGSFNVNGPAYCTATAWTPSDQQFKTNIDSIHSALNTINQLKPKSFYLDTANVYGLNFSNKKQYGFIAQDVETILPELISSITKNADVDTLGNIIHPAITYKGLNYNAFIGILTQGIKEQSNEIDSLKTKTFNQDSINTALQNALRQSIDSLRITTTTQNAIITSLQNQLNQLASLIDGCCNNNGNGQGNGNNNNLMQSGTNNYKSIPTTTLTEVELSNKNSIVLNQNVPNPFAEQTTISYYLPNNVQRAQILFFEQSGKIIKTVDLTEKGKGVLNVFANDLSNGMYTYSLIIDGQIIETKKMIKQ